METPPQIMAHGAYKSRFTCTVSVFFPFRGHFVPTLDALHCFVRYRFPILNDIMWLRTFIEHRRYFVIIFRKTCPICSQFRGCWWRHTFPRAPNWRSETSSWKAMSVLNTHSQLCARFGSHVIGFCCWYSYDCPSTDGLALRIMGYESHECHIWIYRFCQI